MTADCKEENNDSLLLFEYVENINTKRNKNLKNEAFITLEIIWQGVLFRWLLIFSMIDFSKNLKSVVSDIFYKFRFNFVNLSIYLKTAKKFNEIHFTLY